MQTNLHVYTQNQNTQPTYEKYSSYSQTAKRFLNKKKSFLFDVDFDDLRLIEKIVFTFSMERNILFPIHFKHELDDDFEHATS